MGAPMMEWKGICKSYGEKQVLQNMDFSLEKGKITVLMGASGRGKTTLLRILMGLEQADAGERMGTEDVRISAVFQEDRLLDRLTAEGNLRFVAERAEQIEDIPQLLQELGLGGETEAAAAFSGGMKRRLAIARALLADYDLLVLDEPFRGLDEETKRQTMETVCRRSLGKTVLLVTHDEEEARTMAHKMIRI